MTDATGKGTTRRAFLDRSARTAGVLFATSVFGVAAAVRTSGYPDSPPAGAYHVLSIWQGAVVDALAARVCAADVPYDTPNAPPNPREVGVTPFIDNFLAQSPPSERRDLLAAIGCVEHLVPLLSGRLHRFSALPPAAQDAMLTAMETSSISVIRGCFYALKSLLMMGYYRDARTWGVLSYDGPLVGRPDDGWTAPRGLPKALPRAPEGSRR